MKASLRKCHLCMIQGPSCELHSKLDKSYMTRWEVRERPGQFNSVREDYLVSSKVYKEE